jgi:hypothetical protein
MLSTDTTYYDFIFHNDKYTQHIYITKYEIMKNELKINKQTPAV